MGMGMPPNDCISLNRTQTSKDIKIGQPVWRVSWSLAGTLLAAASDTKVRTRANTVMTSSCARFR